MPLVVATTGIWADVVSNVACDGLATVENIIPSGGDPHGFEPSLADRERMEEAALLVVNGLALEESLLTTIEASEGSGVPVFEVADHIDLIDFVFEIEDEEGDHHGEEGDDEMNDDHGEEDDDEMDEEEEGDHDDDEMDEDEEEHHHEPSGSDPHVWFDPVRVSSALPDLAEALIDEAGLDAAAVQECLDVYQAELVALHNEIEQMLESVPNANRKLVTNHDSLGYYANRYGFSVIASIIPGTSTLAETNLAHLGELAHKIEEAGVKAIFAETTLSSRDADALASEVGDDVQVVSLFTGSLGPEGSGAETYIGFLRTNTERITEALS